MKALLASTLAVATVATASLFAAAGDDAPADGVKRVPVVFSEGHETDPRDKGRPVVLVAAGLGVKPEVFRDAFKDVSPAPRGSKPNPEQKQKNKSTLMKALGKHGVTNDRLDEVSDRYRYVPGSGKLWTVKPAKANALVKDGAVIGYEVVDAGHGYSSKPVVSVPGMEEASAEVELAFGKDLETNGSIKAITLPKSK